jgi:hypothetical protein
MISDMNFSIVSQEVASRHLQTLLLASPARAPMADSEAAVVSTAAIVVTTAATAVMSHPKILQILECEIKIKSKLVCLSWLKNWQETKTF